MPARGVPSQGLSGFIEQVAGAGANTERLPVSLAQRNFAADLRHQSGSIG